MKKFFKGLGLFLLILIGLLLISGLFMDKDYAITREVTINQPKDRVFAYISQLRNQNEYSKWALTEPTMKKEFRGTDGTPGFVSAWEGKKMGKGEQEITKITEGERMDTELRFIKPFESKAECFMAARAAGSGQTVVTWGFDGHMPYPFNALKGLSAMIVGKDLQAGLNNLKAKLEQ